MADPITILGALAAASQLAEEGLKITLFLCQLSSQIHASRESTNRRVEQVEQLVSISRQIISSPSLQTENIAAILKTCLEEIRRLEKGLQKVVISPKQNRTVRLARSLKALMKEREIGTHFENLERIKALLNLCISERISASIRTESLEVKSSIETIKPIVSNTSSDMKSVLDTFPAILEQLAFIDQELRHLGNIGSSIPSSHLQMQLEPVLQHLVLKQRGIRVFRPFRSPILTHYCIPPSRTKIFLGFDTTITALKQNLLPSTISPMQQSITILAGVACGGKSQVALEFCHQAQREQQFSAIFWIKASTPAAIDKGFRTVANRLNVSIDEPSEARQKMCLAILAAWPCPWLLVFDNYNGDSIAEDLGPYIPHGPQGAVLITRSAERLSISAGADKTIHLPGLRLQDAVDLLLKRSAVLQTDESYEQGVKLALALEKIPRAILQAGTYVKKHRISIAAYLRMFQAGDPRTPAKFIHDMRTRKNSS